MPRRWGAPIAAALAAALLACAPPEGAVGPVASTATPTPLEFLYLAPAPAATSAFLPAFRGAEVALSVAALEGVTATVTWVELPADLEGWSPPDADGAILAPGTPPSIVDRVASLLAMPTVSLAGGPSTSTWRAIAPGDAAIAAAMVSAGGADPCLVVGPDGHALGAAFLSPEGGTAPARLRAGAVLRDPAIAAGCSAILWPGDGASGAALRRALIDGGLDIPFLAGDHLRDGEFEARIGGGAARGVVVVSGARDVATRLDLRSRRFVQDYQAQVGLPPGPFAVEGWDAAMLLPEVLRDGWPDAFTGVGGNYDLQPPIRPAVMAYVLAGGVWRGR